MVVLIYTYSKLQGQLWKVLVDCVGTWMAWPCPARQNRWRGYACICDRAPGSQLNLDDNEGHLVGT
jgi:hypothetical protein